MKIKNITNEEFRFEGIIIPPQEIIEVNDLIGQRLLALYWHLKLELVEERPKEEMVEKNDINEEQKIELEEQLKEEVKKEPKQFICDRCGKSFTTKVGLVAHQRFCKK